MPAAPTHGLSRPPPGRGSCRGQAFASTMPPLHAVRSRNSRLVRHGALAAHLCPTGGGDDVAGSVTRLGEEAARAARAFLAAPLLPWRSTDLTALSIRETKPANPSSARGRAAHADRGLQAAEPGPSPGKCGAGSRGARAPPDGSAFRVRGCWPWNRRECSGRTAGHRTLPTGPDTRAESRATPHLQLRDGPVAHSRGLAREVVGGHVRRRDRSDVSLHDRLPGAEPGARPVRRFGAPGAFVPMFSELLEKGE